MSHGDSVVDGDGVELGSETAARFDALFDLLREATLRMKDGKTLKTVGFQAGGSAADCEVGYEFALPVDRTEIAAIEIGGQELLLQP